MTDAKRWQFASQAAQALVANTALEPLGVTITALDEKQVVLTMPITNAARQPMGMLHGGVSLLLAESAASMHAAFLVDVNEKVPVGIEVSGSHLNSAADGTVEAVGTVLRLSRSLVVHEVAIWHQETGKQLSAVRVTNYYKTVNRT